MLNYYAICVIKKLLGEKKSFSLVLAGQECADLMWE